VIPASKACYEGPGSAKGLVSKLQCVAKDRRGRFAREIMLGRGESQTSRTDRAHTGHREAHPDSVAHEFAGGDRHRLGRGVRGAIVRQVYRYRVGPG